MAGCNVFLTNSGLRVYIIVAEKNQVVSVGGSLFIKKSAGVRLYEVIAVYKPDIFSMRIRSIATVARTSANVYPFFFLL